MHTTRPRDSLDSSKGFNILMGRTSLLGLKACWCIHASSKGCATLDAAHAVAAAVVGGTFDLTISGVDAFSCKAGLGLDA